MAEKFSHTIRASFVEAAFQRLLEPPVEVMGAFKDMVGELCSAASMADRISSEAPLEPNVLAKPPSPPRENEMHALIERVYHALRHELGYPPSGRQVFRAIEKRGEEFDTDEIVQEVRGGVILWISMREHERRMSARSLDNIVSRIRRKK